MENDQSERVVQTALAGWFPQREIITCVIFLHIAYTHTQTQTHTLYLCQPDILLLNGVLQTVAEGSGQQQVCRLADHIIYLRRAVDGHTHTHTHTHTDTHTDINKRERQRISDCAEAIYSTSRRDLPRLNASTNSLSEISPSANLSIWKILYMPASSNEYITMLWAVRIIRSLTLPQISR